MTMLPAVLLALLQGLTEFLPVSSSGHLILAQHLLGHAGDEDLLYDVMLHVATALAIVVYFRRDLWGVLRGLAAPGGAGFFAGGERRLVGYVLLASLPTAVLGLLIQRYLVALVTRPDVVGGMLLVTGGLLWATRGRGTGRPFSQMRAADALFVGVLQGIAVLPGISRAGATISGGLLRGMDREVAARFSLLISLPAIAGAVLLEVGDALAGPRPALLPFAAGMAVAFGVGYLAIDWILRLLRNDWFHRCALYLWPLGSAAILCYHLF